MSIRFYFIFLLSLIFLSVEAQEKNVVANGWTMKFGYSRINSWPFRKGNIGDIRLEGNYGFLKYLEAGVYCGATLTKTSHDDGTGENYNNYPVLSYGINANIQILPLVFKDKKTRFDLYTSVKVGGYYIFAPKGYYPDGGGLTTSVGGGLVYYPFKRLGIYSEYGYGFGEGVYRAINEYDYPHDKNVGSFRFGLTFRF